MDKEKVSTWIEKELATSNKSRYAMEPWERGYRHSLEGLKRQMNEGSFNEDGDKA